VKEDTWYADGCLRGRDCREKGITYSLYPLIKPVNVGESYINRVGRGIEFGEERYIWVF
jgi:hypothetical protein